jgi:hypothetical protein
MKKKIEPIEFDSIPDQFDYWEFHRRCSDYLARLMMIPEHFFWDRQILDNLKQEMGEEEFKKWLSYQSHDESEIEW